MNHLSAVKQGECPMSPSCSNHSIRCFQKHGFLIGWMMTCDRLMRCGRDELRLSPYSAC
ncbi:MAG: membrane protein insertion efficiency factor YidD [Desulfobacteraceae bacterium]|nr:membrane protein insertion efficiency factor YidD [Desulfobacteraceae bacterium]